MTAATGRMNNGYNDQYIGAMPEEMKRRARPSRFRRPPPIQAKAASGGGLFMAWNLDPGGTRL